MTQFRFIAYTGNKPTPNNGGKQHFAKDADENKIIIRVHRIFCEFPVRIVLGTDLSGTPTKFSVSLGFVTDSNAVEKSNEVRSA